MASPCRSADVLHSDSPDVDPRAVHGLKFAEALPARLGDTEGAHAVLSEPVRFQGVGG